MTYTQVLLKKKDSDSVRTLQTWIKSSNAVLGIELWVKRDGKKEPGWVVTEIGNTQSKDIVKAYENQYKKLVEKTDKDRDPKRKKVT